MIVIEISFEEDCDANYLYERFVQYAKTQEKNILHEHRKLILLDTSSTFIQDILIPELVQFIIKVKENKWMSSLVKHSYFYHNEEEQSEILHIAYSIMNGKRKGLPHKGLHFARKRFIIQSLRSTFEHSLSFSFEAYVRFRLRPYMQYINQLVELSIDEYKLEQDYQAFIETLRQQVSTRDAILSSIHIVFREHIFFYDEAGSRISEQTLREYIDDRILQLEDVYVDQQIIAPLLSISPKIIYIYTAHEDDTMIVTLRNVFQERVKLYSLGEFEKMRQNI